MKIFRLIKNGLLFFIRSFQKPTYVNIISLSPSKMLSGRTALVTGGTSGIGKAISIAFLNAGADVIITGRNEEKIHKVIKELESTCPSNLIKGVVMDNSDISTIPDKIREVINIIGNRKLDILVNNAGVNGGDFENCTESEFDKVIETNLKGAIFLTQRVSEYMVNNGIKGNILNIASSSSVRPVTTAYALSKWGIRGWTIGLAKVLIEKDIVVNGIAPGPTATPMLLGDKVKDISLPNNPSKRFAMPEEIANMAVFLTSDAGRMIVGDIVYMTGGAGTITIDDVKY